MTFVQALLLGILVSISAWLVTNVVLYFLRRHRLKCAIISDIAYHLVGVKEALEYLDGLFQKTLKKGETIKYTHHYTRDDYELYKAVQGDLTKFFGKSNLIKIVKFYKAFWELETLCQGLMLDLQRWRDEKRTLSAEDISYLKKKRDRIKKLGGLLTQRDVKDIKDLPDDYRGRLEPSTMIID